MEALLFERLGLDLRIGAFRLGPADLGLFEKGCLGSWVSSARPEIPGASEFPFSGPGKGLLEVSS